jgi:PAS domain S-box-containing protein
MTGLLTNAPLRYKLLLLPAVAVAALGVLIAVTGGLGLRSTALEADIEHGYFPSYALSRDLEETMGAVQHGLRDAVAARDTGEFTRVDVLHRAMIRRLRTAEQNPVASAPDMQRLAADIDGYYGLARPTAARMIRGETGADLADSIAAMSDRYGEIKRTLDGTLARERWDVAQAFASARRVQRGATAASVGIGVVCVLVVAALSFVVIGSLTGRIKGAVVVANRIAEGDLGVDVPAPARDEIGQLHSAMAQMVGSLRETARVATAIAAGEVAERIAPRGPSDSFGCALRDMADYVRQMAETADRIATGDLEVSIVPRSSDDRFGSAFVGMVDNLALHMEELQSSEEHSRDLAEHLAAARDRLDHLVRSSPAILYSRGVGSDSPFTFVASNLTDLLGGQADALLVDPARWLDRVHPDDQHLLASALARAREQGQGDVSVEYRLCDGAGRYRWILDEMRRIEAREIVGWWIDVTDKRAAEEARRRLAATLEATSDFVGIAGASGNVIYLNGAARRVLGLAEEADISVHSLSDFYAPREREILCNTAMPAALATGMWEGESVLETATGDGVPVSQVIVAHQGENGDAPFLSTIMRDISAWKRLDRVKSEFVSTVSHELRTPLTAIRGSLGLLEGGKAGREPLEPMALKLVRLARENADRLIRLINDMLDLDKIEAGRLELCRTAVAPADLVEATVGGIRGFAEQHGISLETHISTAVASVLGDRDRLVQVLTNLVSNAIKFATPRSAVRLTVSDGDPSQPAGVRFAVENEGPGIAAADLPRLFHRFQQLDSADNRRQGGTGLGLAISKAIVEQHGGHIGVESELAARTTFWFEIPITADRASSGIP